MTSACPQTSPLTIDDFMSGLVRRNPGQPEFQQAVREVAETVIPYINERPELREAQILERLTEPERVISFRVSWQDDQGRVRVNRGCRVQFNNAIGPYKGGLRFHPTVSESVIKFLGFEQIFKNALTTLPMGGGKGGANFNPKGKSDSEIMRFCQAFMTELYRYIGANTDVPAGDIGVGSREICYLFGMYKRLANEFTGAITGKGLEFGGSRIRTEATGYGSVYFMQNMLAARQDQIDGKTCVVSGSGNVAQYTAEKLIELGGKVVTLSDSSGFIHDPEGLNPEKLEFVKQLKNEKRGRLTAYTETFGGTYSEGAKPWSVSCDLAFPSATQNELDADNAKTLVGNGVMGVCEGANMPSTQDAVEIFRKKQILFAPGKAANAGGVAVSGLEQSQNAMRLSWSSEEVDNQLQTIMRNIHEQCVEHGQSGNHVDYVKGANLAGFIKVANAMLAHGVT